MVESLAEVGLRLRKPHYVVGRESEVRYLDQCLATALQGQRQMVFVTGEPGIGKTTVVESFLTEIQTRSGLYIGRGQCVEQYGSGEAYLPLLEVGGQLRRAPDSAHLLTLFRKYAPTWLVQMPFLLESEEVEALQRQVQGATRERMLREGAEMVAALTERNGFALVVEDIHWSDVSTLELLAYLLQRSDPARLLIIATYRPSEMLAATHPLRGMVQELQARSQCHELSLAPLSQQAVDAYVQARFAENTVPDEFSHVLHYRTGGNPLFMVSIVDYLVHQGSALEATPPDADQLHTVQAVMESVPESLRHLIERQLARFTETEQQLLEVASAVGMEFTAAAVAAGLHVAQEDVEEHCERFARAGLFIRSEGVEEWPDGSLSGCYQFTHVLYQNVLYERIAEVRRIRLHQRIGEREEAGYGEHASTRAAALAMHFERGREYRRAIHYCNQAGQHAFVQRRANYEALLHLEKGRELLTHLPDSPDRAKQELQLLTTLSLVLMLTKGYGTPEVEATNARALELCRQVGDATTHFTVLYNMVRFVGGQGQLQTGRELAEQLLVIASQAQDPILLLGAHTSFGSTTLYTGQFRLSQHHLDQAIALYDAQQHQTLAARYGDDPLAVCLAQKSWSLWIQGYPEQATAYSPLAIAYAEKLGYPQNLAGSYFTGALFAVLTQDTTALQQWTAALERIASEQELPYWLAASQIFQGWRRVVDHHPAQGAALISQGWLAYQAIQAKLFHSVFLALLAIAYEKAGQAEEALSIVTEVLDEIEITDERFYEAELHRLKGEVLLNAERGTMNAERKAQTTKFVHRSSFIVHHFEEAEACFQTALAVARRQEAKLWELRAATSLGRLWQEQGKTTEARQLVEDIYGWFTEGFETLDLKEAEALLVALGSTVEHQQASPLPPPPQLPALDFDSPAASLSTQPEIPSVPDRSPEVTLSPSTPEKPSPKKPSPSLPAAEQASAEEPLAAQLFQREGDFWTLAFGGQVCRLKDSRGLHYLAILLQHPNEEIHALRLVTGDVAPPTTTDSASEALLSQLSDAGELLDPQARAAYSQRLNELRQELDEAQTFHDLARADQLQTEIEFLSHELSQAVGLSGRPRKAGSAAERARVSVTRTIRAALTKIQENHPQLDEHLRRTIKTGAFCSYTPDPQLPIDWQF